MKETNINLEVLNPSRKRPKPGDIFVLRPKKYDYIFGRVIKMVPDMLCGFNGPLIYIYKPTFKKINEVPDLLPKNLLVPPIATNYKPWSMGYFKYITNVVLKNEDILPQHCFYDPTNRCYLDENGKPLKRRVEPCGFYGAGSYRTIDDDISEALGIPLAAD